MSSTRKGFGQAQRMKRQGEPAKSPAEILRPVVKKVLDKGTSGMVKGLGAYLRGSNALADRLRPLMQKAGLKAPSFKRHQNISPRRPR